MSLIVLVELHAVPDQVQVMVPSDFLFIVIWLSHALVVGL